MAYYRATDALAALKLPPWRFLFSAWPYRAAAYLIITVLWTVAFLVPVIIAFLLLPIWGVGWGRVQRPRGSMLGFPVIANGHRKPADRRGWLSTRLSEEITWRETAHLLIGVLLGAVTFAVLTIEVLSLVALVSGVPFGGSRASSSARVDLLGAPLGLFVLLALVELAVFSYLNTVLAVLQGLIAQALLSPRQEQLAREVTTLELSRETLIEASTVERRRIERDLHDGVQQRLVSLSMALGMVELEAADAPNADAITAAVAQARDHAEAALAELRRTVRGLHPQVLADHGLSEAIRELATRQPIPTTVRLSIPHRLDEKVELASYYFVSEALTNAVRHSRAELVTLNGRADGRSIVIEVVDDGVGGARPDRGSGLRGLRERAATLAGSLVVDSRNGKGTTLRLTLPTTERASSTVKGTGSPVKEAG